VRLSVARVGWLKLASPQSSYVASFTSKKDRLAVCAYELSGELGVNGASDVGSPLMFGPGLGQVTVYRMHPLLSPSTPSVLLCDLLIRHAGSYPSDLIMIPPPAARAPLS